MDFALTEAQQQIVDAIEKVCTPFDAEYWYARDNDGEFPEAFYRTLADAGWLGIAMPEEFGGAGLGITEAALMMHTIASTGAGLSGASAVHMNIFGLHPVVVFGTQEQKQRMLPPLIAGKDKACFGVTEPNAGLNTLKLKTRAVREGHHYVVHGQKVFISTAREATKMLLLARTKPVEECRGTEGLSLFYTDFDRSKIEVHEIPKMGRKCVDTNQLFIDGLRIPVEDRIGEEGKGFEYILHGGMNPERILIASEAIGLGRAALSRAAKYAGEREVFNRPIGKNQGIQHPLAERWIELEAAFLLAMKAAWLYDQHKPCGAEANAAKFFGADSSACLSLRFCTMAL
ncbi:Acyl-CoA dehydrogenase fadE12 [Paraburkholderia hiiakae]|uniref:Acyl-CoA dehydrogenase fadE12 n=1 Tax=Paraburkholderia hiiakae TaxID=1081782 RepID=A0ABM8NZQ1_9BURK|nr:Acyl-CoA dehydrogenase fadE12 [Paraburkholderia hiiakae]